MSLKNKKSEKVIENKKTDSKEILATLKDITKEYDSGSVKVKALNGVDLTIYIR